VVCSVCCLVPDPGPKNIPRQYLSHFAFVERYLSQKHIRTGPRLRLCLFFLEVASRLDFRLN